MEFGADGLKQTKTHKLVLADILKLADRYSQLRQKLWDFYCDVHRDRMPAKYRARIPSRGTPP